MPRLPKDVSKCAIQVWMPMRKGQQAIAIVDGVDRIFYGDTPIGARKAARLWRDAKAAEQAEKRDARLAERRRQYAAEKAAEEAAQNPDQTAMPALGGEEGTQPDAD